MLIKDMVHLNHIIILYNKYFEIKILYYFKHLQIL